MDEILRELAEASYVHLNTKKSKLSRHTEASWSQIEKEMAGFSEENLRKSLHCHDHR